MIREAATHDYRRPARGHDLIFTPTNGGLKAHVTGWGSGIRVGDYLIIRNPHDPAGARYVVDAISYYRDPPDMWSADVSFAPRTAEER